jgi:ubiquinone/menaquinone biosynthesis C-methylase UbiE
MITKKTDKELAFLHDLFVAPDWGERFAELIDQHLKVPVEGKALYVSIGTGGHAIAIRERTGDKLDMTCIDEKPEFLELAQAKATAANQEVDFRHASLDSFPLEDNQYDLVIGEASLVARERVRNMFKEMARVATPGARVALTLTTSSSFGEFFSIFWEALHNCEVVDLESKVEQLIMELPTVADVEAMAEDVGLDEVESWTRIEEFDYESGDQFLKSPLVSEFLMEDWLACVPDSLREKVSTEISRLINEERHEAEFALSVKATLVVGRKALTH